MLSGLNDSQVLLNGNIRDLPDFAERLFKINSTSDLYSNQYLYLKPPPSYDYVFTQSVQSTQDSNLSPVMKNINKTISVGKEIFPLCIVYIEIFAKNRGNLFPDPELDSV